jgi:hypothetical protein
MKSIFTVLFSVLLTTSFFSQNYTWELKQSGSSLGGPIDVELFNANNVYYGSNNTIYKSTDRGETFSQMGIVVPQATEIKCVIVDDLNPSTIVVGIEGGVIIESKDSSLQIDLSYRTFLDRVWETGLKDASDILFR